MFDMNVDECVMQVSLEPRLSRGGKGETSTHCLCMRQHFRKFFRKTVRLLPANTWLGHVYGNVE